jgi:hypothetical protein
MTAQLEFMDVFHVADCASRVIADHRPKATHGESDRKCSAFLRESGVKTFRALWRSADPGHRQTLAVRLHLWLGTGRAEVVAARLRPPIRSA